MKSLSTKQPAKDLAQQEQRQGYGRSLQPTQEGRSPHPTHLATGTPLLQRQCACGGGCPRCQENRGIQTKLKISEPGDPYEQEADRIADEVMRMPEESVIQHQLELQEEGEVQRKAIAQSQIPEVPPNFHEVLASQGQLLEPATRTFMEARFGHDFSQVQVHTDTKSAEFARAIHAAAFTIGQNIFFGNNQYAPETQTGRRLLAHELTHVLQQKMFSGTVERTRGDSSRQIVTQPSYHIRQNALLQRSVTTVDEPTAPQPIDEGELQTQTPEAVPPPAKSRTATVPSPETCPPPEDLDCSATTSSAGDVTNNLIFPVNSDALSNLQKAEIDATAAAWHAAGGTVTVRVDGYASAEGECGYNWNLSCRRAEAVATELESPTDGSLGVPSSNLEVFAHGESNDAGATLAPNRRATIGFPTLPPPPPRPTPPPCRFPIMLGSARGCGSGTDFTHFDFPSISTTSAASLAAWAAARPLSRGPFRSLVTDTECELEMDGVLTALAGSEGHDAFSRFEAGTGGTVTHGSTSTLGAIALISGSFSRTVSTVQASIETQLAAQATSGALNPCALSVIPPPTFFSPSDGLALKAVIGGTQGEQLFATGFTSNPALRTYSIDLRFIICDDFGVDESDLYAPGLFAFWVLQHERSATKYVPFINELDLTVNISGTF